MAGFRNQVLIYDDDRTLAQALKAAFEREGFTTHIAANQKDARELIDNKPIGTLVIDCLLPEMGGVEFVESIRPKFGPAVLEVILISGIFVDATFIKESLKSTAAKHFLKKPFNVEELVSLVEKPDAHITSTSITLNPRMVLYQMFSQQKITVREKRKALEALDEIYGFDLPFIYSLLVESRISGHLNLVAAKGDVFGISFSGGNVTSVDIPDKETYLGKLLVDKGYLMAEDLSTASADTSPKKFGEKLTSNFYVSPHAIDIALAQQMNIRLSRTIVDEKVSVNLVESEVELTRPYVDQEAFAEFLHDWVVSKISLQWLRAHYAQWMSFTIVKSHLFRPDHQALKTPLVRVLPELIPALNTGGTLAQLVDSQKFAEEPFYKAIHYLLTRGLLLFKKQSKDVSKIDRYKHLNKIYAQFNGLNKLEIFDVISQMVTGGQGTPELVIQEFSKFLGSPPPASERELSSVYQLLTKVAQGAFEFAKTGDRDKMADAMAKDAIELRLKAGQQFEEAKNQLQKSGYKTALDLLLRVQAVDPKVSKLRIYLSWARLGTIEPSKKEKIISEVEMEMLQVTPEDKMDAVYSFVSGLLMKAKGDTHQALKLFQKAASLDPTLIAARRELSLMGKVGPGLKKGDDLLGKDLKDVFGSLFKKKA